MNTPGLFPGIGANPPYSSPYISPTQIFRPYTSPTVINITIKDTNLTHTTYASSVSDWSLVSTGPVFNSWSTSNPAAATVNPSTGYVTWVSNGNAIITGATTSDSFSIGLPFTTSGNSGSTDTWASWVSGSLIGTIENSINAIANVGPTPPSAPLNCDSYNSAISLYSTREDGTGSCVRNNSNWLSSVDLTAVATWSSRYGVQWVPTAITARHCLQANHVGFSIGDTIWFCDNANNHYSRTVTAVNQVSNSDLIVITLNSDLPGTIHPMKVMPIDWDITRAPGYVYRPMWGFTVITNNQTTPGPTPWPQIGSTGFAQIIPSTPVYNQLIGTFWVSGQQPIMNLQRYVIYPAFGTSGNPAMTLIDGYPVLIATYTTGSGGPKVSYWNTQINSILSIAGVYSLSVIALSGYPSY